MRTLAAFANCSSQWSPSRSSPRWRCCSAPSSRSTPFHGARGRARPPRRVHPGPQDAHGVAPPRPAPSPKAPRPRLGLPRARAPPLRLVLPRVVLWSLLDSVSELGVLDVCSCAPLAGAFHHAPPRVGESPRRRPALQLPASAQRPCGVWQRSLPAGIRLGRTRPVHQAAVDVVISVIVIPAPDNGESVAVPSPSPSAPRIVAPSVAVSVGRRFPRSVATLSSPLGLRLGPRNERVQLFGRTATPTRGSAFSHASRGGRVVGAAASRRSLRSRHPARPLGRPMPRAR